MIRIRAMRDEDAEQVLAIYREGIATGHATFETDTPDWDKFSASRLEKPRLVSLDSRDQVTGWAVMSAVSSRCVYGGVGESTVYVAEAARGQGVGHALLNAFLLAAEQAGFWSVQAGIFPENTGSIRLHESCGYRPVGTFIRQGKMRHGPMEGQWRDVHYMQWRSTRTGVD
ncbi:MAG: N-acetyltransferase [Maricaulis sp.]|jgi:phosphinothricin acetyltransferase|nr:N-acetyltransferase [Maricaulis sp.]HAQ33901.1 N-acetyltransferase [Alphaproteobacteria bacterium]